MPSNEQDIIELLTRLERKKTWYIYIDKDNKRYIIPDTTEVYNEDVYGIKALKASSISPNEEVMAFDQKYLTDALMWLRYCKRMRFRDMPKDYTILPGNCEDIEADKKEYFSNGVRE